MRLMHGVEKQELMHHFLGSAGRSAHPTLETWCPATKEQGLAGSGAPRPTCRRPTNPRVVVPRDEGTRVREERSTTPAQTEAPPLRRCPTLTPGRRLIQFRLAPTPPAGGYLSRRQPRPWAGGRKVRTSGAGMVSNPSAAGGPSRPAHPSGPAWRAPTDAGPSRRR